MSLETYVAYRATLRLNIKNQQQHPEGENKMNYQQLRDYALQCSLEHHLCNVEELLDTGKTLDEIMEMVEESDNTGVVIYEPYEYYESESLLSAIEDARGVKVHEFMEVLTRVNGEEWATNYKQEGLKS